MNLHKYLLFLCLGLLFACKKEIKSPPTPITEEPTEQERLRASIYDYFNKYSLWTEQIPDLDEEGQLDFVKGYSSNTALLSALKNMTPQYSFKPYQTLNITVGNRYDRYSFLEESETEGTINRADGFRMDTNDGYGLSFGWGILTANATIAYPVIYFVEGGSPAQKGGVKRGSIVYAINGDEDITVRYNGSSLNQTDVRNFTTKLEAALEANSLDLEVETAEGEEKKYTLGYQDAYDIDPVILDSVYTYPDKNIGYLAYSSFEEVWPKTHQNYEKLEGIFDSFKDAHVKDLILDLRYNTGGYVSTAEYLANKMVKATDHGKLMFKYVVNNYLATSPQHKAGFEDVYFENNNNQLALENVYVLATEQTASASELLISSLKPYLNVTIIAETDRTYGKPVGFFPEEITDDVTLWVTSFKTINADGYTDYWNGMDVDEDNIDDYIFKDFGDATENMIAKALGLAGIPAPSMRASSHKSSSAQRGVKVGLINQPRERNMLKTK